MYKLSYEKCVYFILLVMVVFLSLSSGFRIDSLDMTDVSSKQNSYTSNSHSYTDLLHRLIQNDFPNHNQQLPPETLPPPTTTTSTTTRKHRLRHSSSNRRRKQLLHKPNPTSRIDTIVIPANDYQFAKSTTRPITSEQFAQIPPSDISPLKPTAAIVTRSQRSPNRNNNNNNNNRQQQQQQRKFSCQEQDVARKAYLANTVVLARAESMSSNRVRNYSVSFRILERYKSPPYAVDDTLRLTFLNDTKRMNCQSELSKGVLVKAQIQQSKEYYLFLNSHGHHNYSVLGTPVLKRRRKNKEIERMINSIKTRNFGVKLKTPVLNASDSYLEPHKKFRLFCRVRGYPIPIITWRKNDSELHNNNNTRITYSNKGEETFDRRKSTLVIRSPQERDVGRYSCVATGIGGQETETSLDISFSNSNNAGVRCNGIFATEYCENGGTCYFNESIGEFYCICPSGFGGNRCDTKNVNLGTVNSMYECRLGYPTAYC